MKILHIDSDWPSLRLIPLDPATWTVCVWDGAEGVSLCLCVGGRSFHEICQFLEPGKHTVEVGGEGVSFLKKWDAISARMADTRKSNKI